MIYVYVYICVYLCMFYSVAFYRLTGAMIGSSGALLDSPLNKHLSLHRTIEH